MAYIAVQTAQHTDALLRDVVRLFLLAQRAMIDCCSNATAKECEAMMLLGGQSEPPTVQAFAERMGLEKTWASRLIARMEARGHVRRVENPADGRSWLIELTSNGAREHGVIKKSLNENALTLLRNALARCTSDCIPNRKSSC